MLAGIAASYRAAPATAAFPVSATHQGERTVAADPELSCCTRKRRACVLSTCSWPNWRCLGDELETPADLTARRMVRSAPARGRGSRLLSGCGADVMSGLAGRTPTSCDRGRSAARRRQ